MNCIALAVAATLIALPASAGSLINKDSSSYDIVVKKSGAFARPLVPSKSTVLARLKLAAAMTPSSKTVDWKKTDPQASSLRHRVMTNRADRAATKGRVRLGDEAGQDLIQWIKSPTNGRNNIPSRDKRPTGRHSGHEVDAPAWGRSGAQSCEA